MQFWWPRSPASSPKQVFAQSAKDVRTAFGKHVHRQTTGEGDKTRAAIIAAPIIAGVKRAILAARAGKTPPRDLLAAQLVASYYKNAKDLDDQEHVALIPLAQHILRQMGVGLDQHAAALAGQGGVLFPAGSPAAQQQAALTSQATPFLKHFEGWKEVSHLTNLSSKYMAERDVELFGAAHPGATLEGVTGRIVQIWIDSRLSGPDAETAKTMRRRLTGIRAYWQWLQTYDYVSADHKSFNNRTVKSRQGKAEAADNARQRWSRGEIVTLWQAAIAKGDQPLADLIFIAAHTGARRESIMDYTIEHVRTDEETELRYLHLADKTANGVRDVPLFGPLAAVIDRLLDSANARRASNPGDPSYLIPGESKNKFGKRGDPIGKRFTSLKRKLKHGDQKVLHFARHTVSHLLDARGAPIAFRKSY